MNQWLWAATALLALIAPLTCVVLVAPRIDAFVATQAIAALATLAFLMLAEGFHRSSYGVLALVSALLAFVGSLVFLRFFGRELDL